MGKLFIKVGSQGDYKIIPKWAEGLVEAGKEAAIMINNGCGNTVIAFSLPTRFYATLFFLLGYESLQAEKEFVYLKQIDSYFQNISGCKQDEALLLLDNKRWKRCWFKGVEKIEGNKFIKVDVPGSEKAKHTRYVSNAKIATLRKAVDPDREIAANQTGFSMIGFDTLAQYYQRKEHEILHFLLNSKLSYAVFGSKKIIEEEIKQLELFYLIKKEYMKIKIQHILRFKNFMTEFDFARGVLLSPKEYFELPYDILRAPIIIYDGALAYLNRPENLQSKMEIIFLDRTEPQFSTACSELMGMYYDRDDEIQLPDKKNNEFEAIAFNK